MLVSAASPVIDQQGNIYLKAGCGQTLIIQLLDPETGAPLDISSFSYVFSIAGYPDIPLVAGDDLNSQVVIIPDTFTPPLPLTSAIGWTLKDVTSAPAQPLRFGAIIVTP